MSPGLKALYLDSRFVVVLCNAEVLRKAAGQEGCCVGAELCSIPCKTLVSLQFAGTSHQILIITSISQQHFMYGGRCPGESEYVFQVHFILT